MKEAPKQMIKTWRWVPTSRPIKNDGISAERNGDEFAFKVNAEGGRILFEVSESDFSAWAKAKYLVMDVYHEQDEVLGVQLGFYKDTEAEQPSLLALLGVLPGVKTRLSFPLEALDSQRVFLPRTPGKLKTVVFGEGLKSEEVRAFSIGTPESLNGWEFLAAEIHLSEEEPEYPVPNIPLADPLGQYTRKQWTGKTESERQMVDALRNERSAAAPQRNSDRTAYGGWTGKKFEATGYFRTQREGDRWWLVDPDGGAFYSLGMDSVIPGEVMKTNGVEPLLEWLPDAEGSFKAAWSVIDNSDPLHNGNYFNFAVANLIRAFGDDWFEEWAELTRGRLLQWGFNTVGNWSSMQFIRRSGMPYVLPLENFPTTERLIFRDFPDVFSKEYRKAAVKFAQQLEAFADDRNLIGYFLRNEPLWAFAGDVNLAEILLEKDASYESKHELVRFLSERYEGDIAALNAAWDADFDTFDDLLLPVRGASERSEQAAEDLTAFTCCLIGEYTAVPSIACRDADEHHMNLGMRYAWISSPKLLEGSHYFDVFSINCYKLKPDAEEITDIARRTGMPVMIGEFHFGAPDAGMLATGLRGVTTQEERGKAYRYYVEHAASHKDLVGVHYFVLNDQALLGRFDGENFQIGAVDVCHTPYAGFIEGVTEAHRRVYEIADGRIAPYDMPPREIPRVGF
jgi:hypothetical protein